MSKHWLSHLGKGRRHKRRHRRHLIWQAQKDGLFNRAIYRARIKVLPLP